MTASGNFPTTKGAYQRRLKGKNDGVFAIVSADGSKLLYATYLGGSDADLIRSVALGSDRAVYLSGNSGSGDFPISARAVQKRNKGNHDGVIVRLEPAR